MTAEVVVMNKSAIALAADSKVTVGGSRPSKTYDTVNKLFTLSKIHPVGIMIYGNAEFMGYPWETIIKMYRKTRGRSDEKTIQDWTNDFVKYIRLFGKITLDRKRQNLISFCRSWFGSILDEAEDTAFAEDVSIGSDEFKEIIKEIFDSKTADIADKDEWLDSARSKSFIAKYGKIVDGITDEYFKGFEDDDILKKAEVLISAAIFFKSSSPISSGIVVAGFGGEEYFPTFVSLETDGYIGDNIKIYQESCVDISRDMNACIRAFAQGEMVTRFMSGVDPELRHSLMTAFHETLTDNCLAVLDKYGDNTKKSDDIRELVRKAARASVDKLSQDTEKFTKRNFSSPIVQMVSLLPKEELANLAESLVALTSLKRRVSNDAETVGGAIDVALISKGDGFVWIKRKYYFPEELNPQFNRLYLQEVDGDIYAVPEGSRHSRGAGSSPTGKKATAASSKRRSGSSNKSGTGRAPTS